MESFEFDALARREFPDLARFAMVLCGDRAQAEDIVQDVMVSAYRHRDRIMAMHSPGGYLRRMVANEFLSWRRRWHTRRVIAVDEGALNALAGSAADDPSATAQAGVGHEILWAQLSSLSRPQLVAVALRYYEGLTYEEIGQVMGCRPSSARSACSRGLAALRIKLADADNHPVVKLQAKLPSTERTTS